MLLTVKLLSEEKKKLYLRYSITAKKKRSREIIAVHKVHWYQSSAQTQHEVTRGVDPRNSRSINTLEREVSDRDEILTEDHLKYCRRHSCFFFSFR